jgi:hypothetical protein
VPLTGIIMNMGQIGSVDAMKAENKALLILILDR